MTQMNKYEKKLSKNRVIYKEERFVVVKGVEVLGEGWTESLGLVDTNY